MTNPTVAKPAILVDSLGVRRGNSLVLNNIAFALPAGEIMAIVGPNGSGKSTLLRAIAGLLPAAAGSVGIDGKELSEHTAIAQLVAWVGTATSGEIELTVDEIVGLGRLPWLSRATKLADKEARKESITAEALRTFNLAQLAKRGFDSLSSGEQKRVHLARAFAQQTPIILFDEPTANFDPGQVAHTERWILQLARIGKTIVLATHDIQLVRRLCHRVLAIKGGKQVAFGSIEAVLTEERTTELFAIEHAEIDIST
jgi:iron complex transport system ATP-binding protein